ncbi:MAG TPA: MmgE/PrpD family protein [Candidatus Dormibacteraeota bacterium]|nr:MmgE/PrpD family protein [Candidatus Dormibacteraeota bacterium]
MTRSLTRELVGAVLELRPAEADLAAVRALLLDHLAVAAFGAGTDAGRIMREHVLGDLGGDGPTLPLVGTAQEAPALAAAMGNAVAAASYEYDDTHTAASLHPGAVIFPSALAAVVVSGGDEERFLRAVVAGYEVMCRTGRAVNPQAHRARHFHPTSTTGHFGAAAAAAVCFGLDVDRTVAALTLSGTVAGGSMQFLAEGAWTKQVHPAFAVQRGVQAAQLAARGFPGVHDPIAGERAFLAAESADPRPELLLQGLGRDPLEVRNTGIKPYPSCRNTQTPLDALLLLKRAHGLRPEEVASIRFGLVKPGIVTVWEPVDRKRRPQGLVDAQFSLPYVAAIALVEGRVGLEHFRPERITDRSLWALMDRVECINDPALDRRHPPSWPAWVEVRTKEGAILRQEVENPRGDPANPLTEAELLEKFADCADGAFDERRREELWRTIQRLPERGSLERLLELLRQGVTG